NGNNQQPGGNGNPQQPVGNNQQPGGNGNPQQPGGNNQQPLPPRQQLANSPINPPPSPNLAGINTIRPDSPVLNSGGLYNQQILNVAPGIDRGDPGKPANPNSGLMPQPQSGNSISGNPGNSSILRVESNPGNSPSPQNPSPNGPKPDGNNPPPPGGAPNASLAGFSPAVEVARANLSQTLDAGRVEVAVPQIEVLTQQEYKDYLGESLSLGTAVNSAQNIREMLSKIEKQTGNRSAIVYAIARPDQLELVLMTASGHILHRTVREANREVLIQTANQFRDEITNPVKRRSTSYLSPAQKLYQWLLKPLEAELQGEKIETLLFSLDAGLRTLPIAALHDGKQFLVEKYSLALIPSLSLTNTSYQRLSGASVLAMGASVFSDKSPLPAVPLELQTIAAKWPGQFFLNEAFTLKNLKSLRSATPYQIIHLATHGEFKPGAAGNSYIQLWDAQLQLNQLRQLGWSNPPVELLVLSACRTAVGDNGAELGFAGLAVQAGVKSALASLWYVSDEGTLGLMAGFYSQLRNAAIKSEALRQSQIAMLRGEIKIESGQLRGGGVASGVMLPAGGKNQLSTTLSHPYYWSGFTMIGSPW
ncbi:CHAT domain-containing protein, partial [Kamptonema sp. PCC 6506]|uniref:CHAT domain-containing protein n=2 Tax=Kamptonema TaxID=1501433 RepID=UPI0012F489E7